MANRYKLTISPQTKTFSCMGQKGNARELDIAILEGLFFNAANSMKTPKDIHVCLDFAAQIDDLRVTTVKDFLILDDTDKANLEKGIAVTENQRPLVWYSSPLWKQFDCMEPVKEEL
jgi:hypothetical protein